MAAGHPRAAGIAAEVLREGGNAVDAGVAATIALAVLRSEQVQLGGIAPMMIRWAGDGRVHVVEGVGRWPARADAALLERSFRGRMPGGVLRCVAPAAPDAWLTALARFGTRRFAALAEPARALAEDGVPVDEDLASSSAQFQRAYARFPGNGRIWMPEGRPLEVGETFRQPDLARTLALLIDADRGAGTDRAAGLRAVREAFYEGPLAEAMARHVADEGGWLAREDIAAHRTPVSGATTAAVFGGELHCCGPWSQGPALAQALQVVERSALRAEAGRDEGAFLHLVLEALKLALADREAYYGEPEGGAVPIGALLAPDYADRRAALVGEAAAPALPEPGLPERGPPRPDRPDPAGAASDEPTPDTSHVAVADGEGTLFAATPSDPSNDAPVVPGLGFVISTRGGQSRIGRGHPAALAPGRRPRVSACPFMLRTAEGGWIVGGGPGGDFNLQTAAQVLARHLVRGTPLAEALAAPRAFTQSAPGSSAPHLCFPGQVLVEETVAPDVFDDLARRGHRAVRGTVQGISRPSLGLVATPARGEPTLALGDPRRPGGVVVGPVAGGGWS